MKAARFYGEKDIRVEEVEVSSVGENDVKVRVAWTGICGSDLHEYNAGPIFIPSDEPDPLTGQIAPLTMGHEFSGVIEELGKNVTDYKVGDKVAINPLVISEKHESGLVDMYQGFTFIGLGADGGFADYCVLDQKFLVKLADNVPLEVGALVEPTAVSMQAVRESEMEFGDSVAIFGAGPIGLTNIIAARAAGAREIFVFDLSEERLAKAREVGATHAINSGEINPVEYIKEIYPYGVDRTFEVAGVPITVEQAIQVTRPRGTVTIVSIFEKSFDFNPMMLTSSGVHIVSSLAYEEDIFELTVKMIESGQIDPSPIITGKIELENISEEGFEVLNNDKTHAKILVKLSGES